MSGCLYNYGICPTHLLKDKIMDIILVAVGFAAVVFLIFRLYKTSADAAVAMTKVEERKEPTLAVPAPQKKPRAPRKPKTKK
jgi:hypothetical protein